MVAVQSSLCSHTKDTQSDHILARLKFPAQNPLDSAPDKSICRHRGIRYASCSEAIIGAMLERFVPGFRVAVGETFQVPLQPPGYSRPCHVDFKIEGALFEYHPPRTAGRKGRWGDFPSQRAYMNFQRRMDMAPNANARREVYRAGIAEAHAHYKATRRNLIEASPEHRGTELIVATNPREFYELVICRFSPHPPSEAIFDAIYDQLKREILGNNPAYGANHQRQRAHRGSRKISTRREGGSSVAA